MLWVAEPWGGADYNGLSRQIPIRDRGPIRAPASRPQWWEPPVTSNQEPFKRIDVQEADRLRREGVPIIDTREQDEYIEGHVVGAPLIPHMSVFTRAAEVEEVAGGKDKPVMFICAKGQRSAVAAEFAAAAGFSDLYNIEGGTDAWIEAGLPTEK